MQKQYRLKKRASFAYVYRKGEKASARDLLLLSAKSNEGLKIGLSVSKKVGGAVQRSRVKRILRVGYRAIEPELKTGFLVVVSPRQGILDVKSTDVERELRRGFSKLGMFLAEEA